MNIGALYGLWQNGMEFRFKVASSDKAAVSYVSTCPENL